MAVNCDRTLPVVVSSHRSTCNCIVMKILFGLEYTFTIGIQFERYPLTYSTRPTDLTSISYYWSATVRNANLNMINRVNPRSDKHNK